MKKIAVFLICVLLAACAAQPQRMGVTGGNSFSSFVSNAPQITPTGAEPVPCISGGVTKQCTTQNIANLSSGGGSGSFNPAGSLINIKDPRFGATGNGSTDDTAAIQAAIDYAYDNNIQGIFCPSGTYKISANASYPNADIYLDEPGDLRGNWASPPDYSFSLAFVGQDEGQGNNNNSGCQLLPTNDSNVAFIVGPGQHMTVRGIRISGPNTGASTYRGNLPNTGIGLGIAGGSGGASDTLIENVYVENFYTSYETGANGNGALADSNTFRKVDADNCYYGIYLGQTQNKINEAISSRLACDVDFWSGDSNAITVVGGNFSPYSAQNNSFGISSISSFTKTSDLNGYDYTFTGIIASPDAYWCNVYNSFTFATAHFGVVPATCTSWNSGTNTATFQIWPGWVFGNFGTEDLTSTTDLQNEIAGVSTVYASERVTTALGLGISMEGVHIENPVACQTLYWAGAGFAGATRGTIKNAFYNSDPARTDFAPANSPTAAELAQFYCQQSFPFIEQASNGVAGHLDLDGGDFGQALLSDAPLLLELGPYRFLSARSLGQLAQINERVVYVGTEYAYDQYGISGTFNYESQGNGAGEWDGDYFLPHGLTDTYHAVLNAITDGNLIAPFYGYHPAPSVSPNLSSDLYSLVNGSLGSIGSYPPIDCQTIYKVVGINASGLAHLWARSASCPGWSWGQNLTNAVVGETVTWSFKGQSAMIYLDANTLSWMFPGLAITLSGGNSPSTDEYLITGVYPQLGYVTAMDVTYLGPTQSVPLPGTKTTVYSCSSSCTIGQAAYSWTQY